MTIGEKIKIRRKELCMTQDELAALTGYSGRGAITKIETGVNDLNQTKIKIFAAALRCSPLYLLDMEDESSSVPALSLEEQALLSNFSKLNSAGKEKVYAYVSDLVGNKKYTEDTGSSDVIATA